MGWVEGAIGEAGKCLVPCWGIQCHPMERQVTCFPQTAGTEAQTPDADYCMAFTVWLRSLRSCGEMSWMSFNFPDFSQTDCEVETVPVWLDSCFSKKTAVRSPGWYLQLSSGLGWSGQSSICIMFFGIAQQEAILHGPGSPGTLQGWDLHGSPFSRG